MPVQGLQGTVGQLQVELPVLDGRPHQVEDVTGYWERPCPVWPEGGHIELDGMAQVLQGLLLKDEPILDLLQEDLVPDLLEVTEGENLEAAKGKGHEPGLVSGARGRPPHLLASRHTYEDC